MSLLDAARDYHSRPVTWLRIAPAAVAVSARLAMRRFGPTDMAAAGLAVALYGPLEWVTHHHVLHGLPFGPFGARPATREAASHMAHHRDPDDLEHLFVQLEVVPGSVVGATLGALALTRWTRAPLTALATGLALMSAYHWVHFLMHSPYRPKSSWLAAIEDNHIRHHEPDEQWRMGVLFMSCDRLVARVRRAGTLPTSLETVVTR